MRKFVVFCRPFWQEKTRRNAQKSAKADTPFCTDACNTPVYYTPVSVHPTGASTPPSPEIPKKSQKGVPGPPGPECQKGVEKVPEH